MKPLLSAILFAALIILFTSGNLAPYSSQAAELSLPQKGCPLPLDAQVREARLDRMDPEKLRKILTRLRPMITAYCAWTDGNNPNDKITDPVVSLEEFFDGNRDPGSIGPNLDSQPTPQDFYTFLRNLRSRPQVADVRILFTQYDGPGNWPFSDTIFVITSASPETVATWIPDRFKADIIGIDAHQGQRENIAIPVGMHPVTLWYD